MLEAVIVNTSGLEDRETLETSFATRTGSFHQPDLPGKQNLRANRITKIVSSLIDLHPCYPRIGVAKFPLKNRHWRGRSLTGTSTALAATRKAGHAEI